MFYPEDSLKRGGRFYLCWVADSWPLRFATITHRQLWSQDIRRICEDLLEVMTNESGRPTQRFSLRLSSQLLRGLVRLYQRKVNVLLGIAMHRFPDALKFPERFNTWVALVGGKLESESDYDQFRNKRICDRHFADIYKNRSNRLNALAVPTLHLSGQFENVVHDSTSTQELQPMPPASNTEHFASDAILEHSSIPEDLSSSQAVNTGNTHEIAVFNKIALEHNYASICSQRKASRKGDLCMINSYVIKHANKKWNIHEVKTPKQVRRPLQQITIQEVIQEPVETDQRIEEMIQASGNAVANIQDITLREPQEVPENLLLKPNDGFGEENPDQALQLLQDRTIEMMLVNTEVSAAHSGLDVVLDTTDKSHDKSRLKVKDATVEMERISEHELTMFKKSTTAEELMPQFEKDIPEIPEIPPPEIPVPELPVPQPEKPHEDPIPEEPTVAAVEQPREPQLVEIELEELEFEPQTRRRRIRNRLIIDKKIKINAQHFRARIENPFVELRCENSFEDVISIRVPPELYFQRPCHGGPKLVNNIGFDISRLFSRNLGVVSVIPCAERELEEVLQRISRIAPRTALERIEEEQEVPIAQIGPQAMLEQTTAEVNVTDVNVTNVNVTDALNVTEMPRVSEQMEVDRAEMLTQKVQTLSQERKRRIEAEALISPKRQRSAGYVSFRENQLAKEVSRQAADLEADKENRPANLPQLPTREVEIEVPVQNQEIDEPAPTHNAEKIVSSMLQEAGLADIQAQPPIAVEVEAQTSQLATSKSKSGKGTRSDSSETPLGSLDRTKVSLGDSEQTTDSKRFIRDQWGTEGTMLKILKLVKSGRQPVNVGSLISKGPVIPGYKRIIAARCFSSILKLKQHGFICISKDPDTLEINNINLGPKLRSSQE